MSSADPKLLTMIDRGWALLPTVVARGYTNVSLATARTTITEVAYTTLTVLYVVAYLIFDSRTACESLLRSSAWNCSRYSPKLSWKPLLGRTKQRSCGCCECTPSWVP
jgi:hypothetical protein